MKIVHIGLLFALSACSNKPIDGVDHLNFDAIYRTKSGHEVKYTLGDDKVLQRWNIFNPLEPDENYNSVSITEIGDLIILGNFLIIPKDPSSGIRWSKGSLNCKKILSFNHNNIMTHRIKCYVDTEDEYIIFDYNEFRGILHLEEHCEFCGDDEIESLVSDHGIGAQIHARANAPD